MNSLGSKLVIGDIPKPGNKDYPDTTNAKKTRALSSNEQISTTEVVSLLYSSYKLKRGTSQSEVLLYETLIVIFRFFLSS